MTMDCPQCGSKHCSSRWRSQPFEVAAHNDLPAGAVIAACDQELFRKTYISRLRLGTAELGLSRREVLDWVASTVLFYEGTIYFRSGAVWAIEDCEIDLAFSDADMRWLSGFMTLDVGAALPKRRPQRRILERLRLLDLAFRIAKPDLARHFGR